MPPRRDILAPVAGSVHLYSGMPVRAMALTGERTLLDYLVQPLFDSFTQAFREDSSRLQQSVRYAPGSSAGTVTPIMSPSRTIDASRSSLQFSVPAGRRGSTIQR